MPGMISIAMLYVEQDDALRRGGNQLLIIFVLNIFKIFITSNSLDFDEHFYIEKMFF